MQTGQKNQTQGHNLLILDYVHRLNFKNLTFWTQTLLLSSGKEAHSMVDPSDQAILSHWVPWKHRTC